MDKARLKIINMVQAGSFGEASESHLSKCNAAKDDDNGDVISVV